MEKYIKKEKLQVIQYHGLAMWAKRMIKSGYFMVHIVKKALVMQEVIPFIDT